MNGNELKVFAEAKGIGPVDICHEADISIPTLYKVYKDQKVKPRTRQKVETAIRRLAGKVERIA